MNKTIEMLFKLKNFWLSYVTISEGSGFLRHRPPLFQVCQVATVVMENFLILNVVEWELNKVSLQK